MDGAADPSDSSGTDTGSPTNWHLSDAVQRRLSETVGVVLVGDLTGDGRDDAVVIASSIYVFIQNADRTLAGPRSYAHGTGASTGVFHAALAKLDASRPPDLVIGYDDGIGILRNDGAGQFPSEERIKGSSLVSERIRITDVDGDTLPDILAGGYGAFLFTAYLGDGTGRVRTQQSFVPRGLILMRDFDLADVTGDGLADALVLTNNGQPATLVGYPHRGGSFSTEAVSLPNAAPNDGLWNSIATGDIDGDTLADVIITHPTNSPTFISVFRQGPAGTFSSPRNTSSYDIPEPIVVTDIDGDRRSDVIVLHGGWERVGVYLQGSTGLTPERLFPIPYATHYEHDGVAVGDLDSDGCKDLAFATYTEGLTITYGRDCVRTRMPADPKRP